MRPTWPAAARGRRAVPDVGPVHSPVETFAIAASNRESEPSVPIQSQP